MGKWPDGGCTWDSDCVTGYECEAGECQSKGNAGSVTLKFNKQISPIEKILTAAGYRNNKSNCM